MTMTNQTTDCSSSGFPEEVCRKIGTNLGTAQEDMVAFRRDLHAHPEPAGQEHRTTACLAERLQKHGLELRPLPGTGVVADLHVGAPDDAWMAVRADIDCVPIDDEKNVPWRSTIEGHCHACGHDAHTTMALFAAESLAAHRSDLESANLAANVRFVFQPAEETATGARDMIEAGVLDGVSGMVALHCDPFLDVGQVGLRTGPITSHMSTFRITLTGAGGHSARPHEVIDPVPAAINAVSMLYQLAPRSMDSRYPMCLSVTSIHAGNAFNAIPDEAVICGTLRAGRLEDEQKVRQAIDRCLRAACEATGCTVSIEYPYRSPATNNDHGANQLIEHAAQNVVGNEGIIQIDLPSLGGEDFAYFQQHVPASMARLGTGSGPEADRQPLHSPRFDINETALPIGARLLAGAAIRGMASMRNGSADKPF
ncbi:MAG: amidohydrolase [Phycisphaerales bacterium]|nr:amidohydrolase [Phycisphaerales bacterium]